MRFAPATGDKETRAKPVSAQVEAGNVKLVRGPWNGEFLRVLENFPAGRHDDEVDALSGAHSMLSQSAGICAGGVGSCLSRRARALSAFGGDRPDDGQSGPASGGRRTLL